MRFLLLALVIVVIGAVATFMVELPEVRAWQATTSIERQREPGARPAPGEVQLGPTPTIPDLPLRLGAE